MPIINGGSSSGIGSDGWTVAADPWVYASASTFTIAGVDRTAVFTPGTRLKLTNSTLKYFVVLSSAFSTNTTVTVTGGSDYSLANAAITSPRYSYQASPAGYPATFSWTPGWTGFSANPTVREARFAVLGNIATVWYADNADGTSNATTMTVTGLPVTPSASYSFVGYQCTVVNSGLTLNSPGNAFFAGGSATLTIQRTLDGGTGFTASGAKGVTGGLQPMTFLL